MLRTKLALIALTCGLLACGGDDGGGQCGDLAPCGGDPVGTWNFVDQCVTAISDQQCGITLVSEDVDLTGTITLVADGTYTGTSTVSGSITQNLPNACFAGAPITMCNEIDDPANGVSCTGDFAVGCDCVVTVNDTASDPGTWSVSGTAITLDGSTLPDQYCVDGNSFSIQTNDDGFVAEIVLTK